MQVKQIYEIANKLVNQKVGTSEVEIVDTKTLLDWGSTVQDITNVDNYVRKLVDVIGKQVFVNRPYTVSVKSILKDSWEYGSVLEKISCEPIEAQANDRWNLQDGTSYDTNIFYKPQVEVKFYNSKDTYMIPISFSYDQVKSSLLDENAMNQFFSMIQTEVMNGVTLRTEGLTQTAINGAIAEVLTNGTPAQKVGLLTEYNAKYGQTLTADKALNTPEFIRYAVYRMGVAKTRLGHMSTVFNVGKKRRFTTADRLNTVLLDDFAKASGVFLENGQGQFKTEYLSLPNAEVVSYWQGSGANYDFETISKISVKNQAGSEVTKSGILGVMFDRDAIMLCNEANKATSKYNEVGDFFTNWYMYDASYFIDTNENIVVFTLD